MKLSAFVAAGAMFVAIAGCGGDGGGGGGSSNVVVSGSISGLGSTPGAQPLMLDGIEVRGLLGGDEISDTNSGDDGSYRLRLSVDGPQTVVIAFREAGYAPVYRTIDVQPGADIPMSVTLRELDSLDCGIAGGNCAIDGGRLSIGGLPDGFSGGARVFNPVTESDAFPGGFNDSEGSLLLSGTFAAVELEDDLGDPVDGLPAPVDLRMAFPQDTWSIVLDITPGNGQIDVPMYAFDEDLGTWVAEGQGVLEDADGILLAETDVALLKDGSFDGTVFARSTVSHFSYWNVDWPIETHTCVTGTILDENSAPAAGATITVSGVTYAGTTTPLTVGADGRFCIDMMKSEGVGEDVDQDGITNETQQVTIRVFHEGQIYDGGTIDTPEAQGTCEAGNCTDIGNVTLGPASRLQTTLCAIDGTVTVSGEAQEGAQVVGWDDSVPTEIYQTLCGAGGCVPVDVTDAAGAYGVSIPVLSGVRLSAYFSEVVGPDQIIRWGNRFVPNCPTADVEVPLTDGYAYTTLTVTITGNTIDWEPPRPATYVFVTGAAGQKWMIVEDTSLITPPVTYGTTPVGAFEVFPTSGSPDPLAAGDQVTIASLGTTSGGLPSYGTGVGVVP